jgi:hypothetical protein
LNTLETTPLILINFLPDNAFVITSSFSNRGVASLGYASIL